MRHSFLTLCVLLAFTSCGPSDPVELCTEYFEPYPDLVTDRARNTANARYIDAMIAYRNKDYKEAIIGLEEYLVRPNNDPAVRLYLSCAYLATGDPNKAELQLDHIQNAHLPGFEDQVDWYNALCLLCGGQTDRAKAQAEYIASRPAHTYKEQARQLAASL